MSLINYAELSIKYFIIVLMALAFSTNAKAQAILDFTESFKLVCPKSSTILPKKIFLTITKINRRGTEPCDDNYLKVLAKSCKSKVSCNEIIATYNKSISSFQGKIIGH